MSTRADRARAAPARMSKITTYLYAGLDPVLLASAARNDEQNNPAKYPIYMPGIVLSRVCVYTRYSVKFVGKDISGKPLKGVTPAGRTGCSLPPAPAAAQENQRTGSKMPEHLDEI